MEEGQIYVGVPAMDAICRGLAEEPNLQSSWGSRVRSSLLCALLRALLHCSVHAVYVLHCSIISALLLDCSGQIAVPDLHPRAEEVHSADASSMW